MKIKIHYMFDPAYDPSYFAKTLVDGVSHYVCEESFPKAREKLIQRVKAARLGSVTLVPPDEEVDV